MSVLPTSETTAPGGRLTRRGFIAAGIAGGFALAACSQSKPPPSGNAQLAAAIAAAEAARPHSGRTVTARLTAQQVQVDLGGPVVRTLAYGNAIPGSPIRARIGDELAVTVSNRLDRPTSVHWHGIALRNDMDGAAPATPNRTSPTGSPSRTPAPTGPIRTPVWTPTRAFTCRSSSTTRPKATTTPNGLWSLMIGPTASGSRRSSSTPN
ncbi:oxidase [Mycobacterium europaeum]|uniref:Oxidase n=1 Tax=Mycobacterium europaeum TaxID=761804 RepID=A0A0U1CWN1_9MYCO|nr:oxidase [Mycobacterium europaeum]